MSGPQAGNMAKIYYVSKKTKDSEQFNFFKTKEEALKYGKSQFSDFEMEWVRVKDIRWEGDFAITGILLTWQDGAYVQGHNSDKEARKYTKKEADSALFFDSFKKGMYGILSKKGAEGKGYTWKFDGKEYINESTKNNGTMKYLKSFESFTNK